MVSKSKIVYPSLYILLRRAKYTVYLSIFISILRKILHAYGVDVQVETHIDSKICRNETSRWQRAHIYYECVTGPSSSHQQEKLTKNVKNVNVSLRYLQVYF